MYETKSIQYYLQLLTYMSTFIVHNLKQQYLYSASMYCVQDVFVNHLFIFFMFGKRKQAKDLEMEMKFSSNCFYFYFLYLYLLKPGALMNPSTILADHVRLSWEYIRPLEKNSD